MSSSAVLPSQSDADARLSAAAAMLTCCLVLVLLYFVEYSWRLEWWFWPKPHGSYKGNGPVGWAFFREEFLTRSISHPRLAWVPTTFLALLGIVIAADCWSRIPRQGLVHLMQGIFLCGIVIPWFLAWWGRDLPQSYEKGEFWSICAIIVSAVTWHAARTSRERHSYPPAEGPPSK